MDQATLVGLDIEAGSKALFGLDSANINIVVALWMISGDHESWQLVLSSPTFDPMHRLQAYELVSDILRASVPYTLLPVLILPVKDAFVKDLRKLFGKSAETVGMRLGGQTLGGRFITDAYVYRIR